MYNELIMNPEMLRKLNSATKYPSILTYHALGPRGSMAEGLSEDQTFSANAELYITEKIDGTNSRAVMFTDSNGQVEDYIIGSREDILFAMNDRIINPSQGIIAQMKPCVEKLIEKVCHESGYSLPADSIVCLYGETYGGKINGAKQYTGHGVSSIRFFDYWTMSKETLNRILDLSLDRISSWREHGGQTFVSVDELRDLCQHAGLEMVPYIGTIAANTFPVTLQDTWAWLQDFSISHASLDEDAKKNSEGVVVRTGSRSMIRKLRFEDYGKSKRMGLI